MWPALHRHPCACLGSTRGDPDSQTREETGASAGLEAHCTPLLQPQQRTSASEAQGWKQARQRAYPPAETAKESRKKTAWTTRRHLCRALIQSPSSSGLIRIEISCGSQSTDFSRWGFSSIQPRTSCLSANQKSSQNLRVGSH